MTTLTLWHSLVKHLFIVHNSSVWSCVTRRLSHRPRFHLENSAALDGSILLPENHKIHLIALIHYKWEKSAFKDERVCPCDITSRMWCKSVMRLLFALVSVSFNRELILNPSALPVWLPWQKGKVNQMRNQFSVKIRHFRTNREGVWVNDTSNLAALCSVGNFSRFDLHGDMKGYS